MENALGIYQNVHFPPPSAWNMKGVFLRFSPWEPGEVSRSESTKMSSSIKIVTQGVSHFWGNSYSGYINSSNLPVKYSYQFVTIVVPSALVIHRSFVYSDFWWQFIMWSHLFLIGPKKVGFHFVQHFFYKDGSGESKLFMCHCWNFNSLRSKSTLDQLLTFKFVQWTVVFKFERNKVA